MERFIKKLLYILSVFFIPIICFTIFWLNYYEIPPPRFSENLSLNEKVRFVKQNFLKEKIDILAIGSSMTQNNLYTKTITEHFKGKKFLNLSSWSQRIDQDFHWIKIIEKNIIQK